jgi:hypothetical protein
VDRSSDGDETGVFATGFDVGVSFMISLLSVSFPEFDVGGEGYFGSKVPQLPGIAPKQLSAKNGYHFKGKNAVLGSINLAPGALRFAETAGVKRAIETFGSRIDRKTFSTRASKSTGRFACKPGEEPEVAERRKPSGDVKPEGSRRLASFKERRRFRDCSYAGRPGGRAGAGQQSTGQTS